MRRLSLAIFALAFGSVAASAADMAVKAPPPPPPIFNWSGIYVGGFVGGAVTDRDVWATEPQSAPLVFYNGLALGTGYGLDSSFIGGGTIGYNWQQPGTNFVLGVEGEAG